MPVVLCVKAGAVEPSIYENSLSAQHFSVLFDSLQFLIQKSD